MNRRLFPHSLVVFACLGSLLLMPGALAQMPVLSLGPFTSAGNMECIIPGDTLNLEGTISMAGAVASEWNQNGVELRSPEMLICTASLSECPPRTPSACYCEQFEAGTATYTVKFTRPAENRYSERPMFLRITSPDHEEFATSGQAMYPYVNGAVSARISYGSKSKLSDIDGTALDIPDDDQFLNMAISGLRQPFSISYSTNLVGDSGEMGNMDEVSIPVSNGVSLLTVTYEEDEYCERDGTYSFTVTSVPRQIPDLDIESLTYDCPVENLGTISLQATVYLPSAEASDWSQTVHLSYQGSETNQEICRVLLNECPPSDVSSHDCYCSQHNGDEYTIVGSLATSVLPSGKDIRLEMFSSDSTVLATSNSVTYPTVIRDDIQISMTYMSDEGNRRYTPPVNNSELDEPEGNQRLVLTVNGLVQPFSIVYVKRGGFEVTDNRSTVTFPIDDDVERIQLYYEEDIKCHRRAVYYFTVEDDDDDLSTGEIVAIIFGGILLFVIIFVFIIVYMIVRARNNNQDKNPQPASAATIEERGGIIDYSTNDIEDGLNQGNGHSYDNKAYVVDVPANSSSVVMNPVFDESAKEPKDVETADPPKQEGPSYESLDNGKPAKTSSVEVEHHDVNRTEPYHAYAELYDKKPTDITPGDENVKDGEPTKQGPYISVISTSL